MMDYALQLLALGGLLALLLVAVQFFLQQHRLHRLALAVAELEREHLRQRIGMLADQRRFERERSQLSWDGFRKFRIIEKRLECADICSFLLAPHDGKPLPPYLPGQYLTFQLHISGQPKPVIRCYSLSDRPGNPNQYRVTIKRLKAPPDRKDAPPGLVSNHFHDHLKVGDILDVKAPNGQFCLDLTKSTPIVLLAGGVGITPLLSMLNAVAAQQSTREVWFFYGVTHSGEHILREHFENLARALPSLHLHVCYSAATQDDKRGQRFHHAERISLDLLQRLLPSNQLEFYICGPPPMMSALVEGLKSWGVPEQRIFFEAFGPATFKKPALQAGGSTTTAALKIHFARSDKTCAWQTDAGSLLELAEKNGVTIDSGCRAGNCGTCLVAIKSGEVTYLHEPGASVEAGSCLTCIAVPKTALTVDA
jgi:ferredoxin-NADP reductase